MTEIFARLAEGFLALSGTAAIPWWQPIPVIMAGILVGLFVGVMPGLSAPRRCAWSSPGADPLGGRVAHDKSAAFPPAYGCRGGKGRNRWSRRILCDPPPCRCSV